MGEAAYNLIMFLSSKWFIMALFLLMVIGGMIIGKVSRDKERENKSDLDKTVASFSGMKEAPWEEPAGEDMNHEEGSVEKFYKQKTSRRANIKRIIWSEKRTMQKRASEVAKKGEDNEL